MILPLIEGLFFDGFLAKAELSWGVLPSWREVLAKAKSTGKARIYRRCRTMRVKITLACSECKQRNYDTKKNKKNDPDRLEMNKYCRFCRKHTLHKETK